MTTQINQKNHEKHPFIIVVTIALTTALHAKEKCPLDNEYYCAQYNLAQQGDANAQFNLGNLYYSGEGVAQDKREATRRLEEIDQRSAP